MPIIESFNIKVNYTDNQVDQQAIVLLHGWGQRIEMMEPIASHYEKHFRVINIDLPGFGLSEEPLRAWGVSEYTECVRNILEQLNISNPIFIAHSFGARIAILFASKYHTHKCILTGAAGLRPKRSWDYHVRVAAFKTAKQVFRLPLLNRYQEQMRQFFGSADYRAISGVMRSSFVKIVNEDLTGRLSLIKSPTLLVWGENDDATPLWMGKVMEKKIPDAGLVIFEDDDHYAYWNQITRFLSITDVFLKEDMIN
mgnify:CR=1 FL=1